MAARKKKLFNKRIEKKREKNNNFLQRLASLSYQKPVKLPAMMKTTRAPKEAVDCALCGVMYENGLP
jgi:hypothetical protein